MTHIDERSESGGRGPTGSAGGEGVLPFSIDSGALAGVVGAGRSTQTTTLPGYRSETSQTDYNKCVATVLKHAPGEVPSTAAPWNPFATDANTARRDRNTIDRMRTTCGLPPG